MSKMSSSLRDGLRSLAMEELYWARPVPRIVEGHDALYDMAAATIGADTQVDYLEFGVANGKSLIKMADRFKHRSSRFFGFDSFLGLPEDWLMHKIGAFSRGGQLPPMTDARITLVPGWFQNTVPDFLRRFSPRRRAKVLIHYDADLYASTLFVLASIWPRISNYHFMMDDFVHDDAVALRDFSAAYPVEIKFLGQTRGGGTRPNPDQVLATMERTAFTI